MKEITTQVAIVGAGPAGVVLAYLLARKGIEVTLLEAQKDFDRDFRGDTIHPNIMENLDQLGLADEVLELNHSKLKKPILHLPSGEYTLGDFGIIDSTYPYVTLIPQVDFLNFMVKKAQTFACFTLMMNTKATGLQMKEGTNEYQLECEGPDGDLRIDADLIMGADGRFSAIRNFLKKDIQAKDVPVDILWFKAPKNDENKKKGIGAYVKNGSMLVQLERHDHWQLGLMIEKGSFPKLKKEGIEAMKTLVLELDPTLKSEMKSITDWDQIGFLPIECGQVKEWSDRNVLLIGDAAHVMSPVGGVGINYAIQDAIVTFNLLKTPLKEKTLTPEHLKKVQADRKWPTWMILTLQNFAHQRIIRTIIDKKEEPSVPFFLKWQWVRNIILRRIALGFGRVVVEE